MTMSDLEKKFEKLYEMLLSFESIMIAYSGGVDSTFLLAAAKKAPCISVLAVTAVSPLYPAHEIESAVKTASLFEVKHITVENSALSDKAFIKNAPDRCYVCKSRLFIKMKSLAADNNCSVVLDGTNADDAKTYRPGMRALDELGIKSPLKDCGLTKAEIRILSKRLGILTWDKPSCACLASRFPYGVMLKEKDVLKVEKAEACIRKYIDGQFRVRHYADTARIEVLSKDIQVFLDSSIRKAVIATFKDIGYTYVTLDMEGFRSGSMDEVLLKKEF